MRHADNFRHTLNLALSFLGSGNLCVVRLVCPHAASNQLASYYCIPARQTTLVGFECKSCSLIAQLRRYLLFPHTRLRAAIRNATFPCLDHLTCLACRTVLSELRLRRTLIRNDSSLSCDSSQCWHLLQDEQPGKIEPLNCMVDQSAPRSLSM